MLGSRTWTWALIVPVLLAGCAGSRVHQAPVEDRSTGAVRSAPTEAVPSTRPLPGAENAGKPGYYTVKRGDTLIRIGLDNGQSWRDIARWNNLDNPNVIEVGQVLRVAPPASEVAVARPITPPQIVGTPLAPASGARAPAATASGAAAASSAPAVPPSAANTTPIPPEEDLGWIWPAQGTLAGTFDEVKNKGVDITGKAGDPVLAAADGRVVYAGAGLRGYGNLIILKHNNTFLTAYAHNQTLLIKEDQSVRKGQKIAEMGNTDADQVKLHFEVRRQGKPVDPLRYLPAR